MILLTQNTINQITVSVTENLQAPVTSSGAYYLFQVVNDTNRQTYSTILQDVSDDRYSYNTFYLSVTTGSANYLSGSISLPLAGFYSYSFYEGTGSTNPTSSTGLTLLEIGKVQLLTSATQSALVSYTSSYDNIQVYNPAAYGL
jgi:hypothetical protein